MNEPTADSDHSRRIKILMITDRVPGRSTGYGIRVSNVLEGLLAVGEVHLCAIDSSSHGATLDVDHRLTHSIIRVEEPPRWRRIFDSLWTIPNIRYKDETELRSRLMSIAGAQAWDVVWFSRARVYSVCADLFEGVHILDLDDLNDRLLTTLVDDRSARLGLPKALPQNFVNLLAARRWSNLYEELSGTAEQLVVCHEEDRQRLASRKVAIVPNGYMAQGSPQPMRTAKDTLLFVGPLNYEPNYLAVRWFLDEVLDRIRASVPNAKLSVVGDLKGVRSAALSHHAATFHGLVDDVGPYYAAADVALAPLRSGGGTRIKILEAMARHCPLVATPFACEGLAVTADEDLYIAESAEDFAARCVMLLTNSEEATRLADNALATFLLLYTAERCRASVSDLVVSSVRTKDHPETRP